MFHTFVSRLFPLRFPVVRRLLKYVTAGRVAVGGASLSLSVLSSDATTCSKADFEKVGKELDCIVPMREADVFYDDYLLDRAYEILQKYKSSDNAELLWRLARVLCELGKNEKNGKEKKRLFSEALKVAKSALDTESNARDSGCFAAHKWYAIALYYVSKMEGTKSQIKNSLDAKAHFERAVQLNPSDLTSWHLLGIWHYFFADFSTVSRMATSAFFASPPSSTFEEALRHFQRAEAVEPGSCSTNAYYMGLCLEKLNRDKAETLEWFKKAFIAPVLTKIDEETHLNVAEHLSKKYGFSQEKLEKLINTKDHVS